MHVDLQTFVYTSFSNTKKSLDLTAQALFLHYFVARTQHEIRAGWRFSIIFRYLLIDAPGYSKIAY